MLMTPLSQSGRRQEIKLERQGQLETCRWMEKEEILSREWMEDGSCDFISSDQILVLKTVKRYGKKGSEEEGEEWENSD